VTGVQTCALPIWKLCDWLICVSYTLIIHITMTLLRSPIKVRQARKTIEMGMMAYSTLLAHSACTRCRRWKMYSIIYQSINQSFININEHCYAALTQQSASFNVKRRTRRRVFLSVKHWSPWGAIEVLWHTSRFTDSILYRGEQTNKQGLRSLRWMSITDGCHVITSNTHDTRWPEQIFDRKSWSAP